MIPNHIAALANALMAESMDLHFELAVELAYAVSKHLLKDGYSVQAVSSGEPA